MKPFSWPKYRNDEKRRVRKKHENSRRRWYSSVLGIQQPKGRLVYLYGIDSNRIRIYTSSPKRFRCIEKRINRAIAIRERELLAIRERELLVPFN